METWIKPVVPWFNFDPQPHESAHTPLLEVESLSPVGKRVAVCTLEGALVGSGRKNLQGSVLGYEL